MEKRVYSRGRTGQLQGTGTTNGGIFTSNVEAHVSSTVYKPYSLFIVYHVWGILENFQEDTD